MGRTAAGVRGITLRGDDQVVSMEILEKDKQVLHVTERGVGKRTKEDEYRVTNRGGKGVFTCKLNDDTGDVVAVKAVTGEEDLMLMTVDGVIIRIPVEGIAETGRNTQGVRLIRLQEDERVAAVAKIDPEEELEEAEEQEVESAEEIEADLQAAKDEQALAGTVQEEDLQVDVDIEDEDSEEDSDDEE